MDLYSSPPFQPQLALSEFFDAFRRPRLRGVETPSEQHDLKGLCARLLVEELEEVKAALVHGDRYAIAHELADLVYVAFFAAEFYGIDLEVAFREIHRANMSKLDADGQPILREDGKILKGPNYSPPDIDRLGVQGPVQLSLF